MQSYRTAVTDLKLEDIPFGPHGITLLCDTSAAHPRPIVPQNLRREVFETFHNVAHPSVRTTKDLIAKRFVWHGLRRDVGVWAKQCIPCQTSKVQTHVRAPIEHYEQNVQRFSHINVDIVGPLPQSNGFTYLFTIVDRFTRWPEAVPMYDATTTSCAQALAHGWISRFGPPQHISSDRGSVFTSELWAELSRFLGIQLHHTTSFHPQSNGLVERFHRHLKSSLMARCASTNWYTHLPWVLLGIRTSVKEDLGTSSAELVYGSAIALPGEFFNPTTSSPTVLLKEIRDSIRSLSPTQMSRHGRHSEHVPRELLVCEFVFLRTDKHRTPLQPPYTGPFRVLQRRPKNFKIDVGGRKETVSVDRLKPAFLDSSSKVVTPVARRRGRPPKPSTKQTAKSVPSPSVPAQGTNLYTTRAGRIVRQPVKF